MGFKISGKTIGSLAGGAIGAAFGGAGGAGIGASIGGALLGGDDDMTALQAYQMQRADAIADWNMQNAYNDPSAQMARLHKAGLNPYMIYNSGNAVGNSSSSIDTPTYKPTYAQPLSQQLTRALQNLNFRSMKADTKGKEIDTEMRELNLAIKKAQLARLTTGRGLPDGTGGKSHWLDLFMTQSHRRALLGLYNDFDLVPNDTPKARSFGSAFSHWLNSSSPYSTAGMF